MLGNLIGKLAAGGRHPLIGSYVKEYERTHRVPKLDSFKGGKAILELDPVEQIALLQKVFVENGQAIERFAEANRELETYYGRNGYAGGNERLSSEWAQTNETRRAIDHLASDLLKRNLPFGADDLARLCNTMIDSRTPWPEYWPVLPLVAAIEKFTKDNACSPTLTEALGRLMGFVGAGDWAGTRKLATRVGAILSKQEGAPDIMLIASDWGQRVAAFVNGQEKKTKQLWTPIFRHAVEIQDKTKPTAAWLTAVKAPLEQLGDEAFTVVLGEWFAPCTADTIHQDPNTDTIKALVWMAARVEDDGMPSVLGRFCETCYRKVPGVGPANIKLGNACIYALGEMPGGRAVAELVRLRSRIKFNQGRKQLEKALAEAAERAGLTVADLEEIALPAFGLDADGARQVAMGEVTAEIRITGSDEVTLSWTGADGKPRKSVPASVKADHADELKALRAEIKEIKGLLAGQRYRLESLYLAQRSWPLADWRKRYLAHPLLANLARRLVWKFGDAVAVPMGDGFIGVDGEAVEPAADVSVSLWHPLDSDAAGVLAWRRRLAALEVTQPFKQAHREIYILTDAERETNVYSNRFAAHILRQHQMNALCRARGWRYNLQGAWDQEESVPTLELPNWRISVEFWVDYASDDCLESGVYIYRATDQVRFLNEVDDTIPLERVPPLVLSEAMRDVDLFVGVASVGNDPEWLDRGPDAPFRQYWSDFSFGALGETAKTRKAVLEELLPKLKIADKCEISGKFLKVRGTKRTYKIHLGSGNILMEPNDQYLCIVQGRGKAGSARSDNLRLPFEGDGVLSIILSKAFLLTADDKITDKTILSQIGK